MIVSHYCVVVNIRRNHCYPDPPPYTHPLNRPSLSPPLLHLPLLSTPPVTFVHFASLESSLSNQSTLHPSPLRSSCSIPEEDKGSYCAVKPISRVTLPQHLREENGKSKIGDALLSMRWLLRTITRDNLWIVFFSSVFFFLSFLFFWCSFSFPCPGRFVTEFKIGTVCN